VAKLFALHDKEAGPPHPVPSEALAKRANDDGYGVFHVVNEYEGRRVVENLKRINYWFADLDTGTKEEQLARIATHLKPSRVVETRKGFHCYWRAIDATLGTWNRIVKHGIAPALEADPRATDPLRLLRAPGYYHHKQEPFLVRVVAECDVAYRESQMLEAFADSRADIVEKEANRQSAALGPVTFWVKVSQLSAKDFITRISGHALVKGERYALMPTSGGKHNILVKKPGEPRFTGTPCWITEEDRFAGVEGGSSPAAWLKWFGHSWKEIAEGLKETFKELGDE
jgi:hypothetical protein